MIHIFRFFLIGVFLLLQYNTGLSQAYSINNKGAIKKYEQGKEALLEGDHKRAIRLFEKSIKKSPDFAEAYFMLGEVYYELKQIRKYIDYYEKGIKANPAVFPQGYILISESAFQLGEYKMALDAIKNIYNMGRMAPSLKKRADKQLKKCEVAWELYNNPVPFNLINLGDSINTEYDEYWPSLSVDEQKLIYTARRPVDTSRPYSRYNGQEDFYISTKADTIWTKGEAIGPPINTELNEGAQSISADGKTMVFTACDRPGGVGKCDLYISYKKGEKWSNPKNIGAPVNTPFSEKQASLSAHGDVLYFISDRSSGAGAFDIFYSIRIDDRWSKPVNIGDKINTVEDENSPFIHPDDQTLYFASRGQLGMGDFDIFFSRRNDSGAWQKPVNIGYPINTLGDERGLFINSKGTDAYFSSDRDTSRLIDIYTFRLYKEARPDPVSYMKGRVYDSETRAPIEAKFELFELSSGTLIHTATSDPENGEFLVCIPSGKKYMINVNQKGYLFYSDHFEVERNYEKLKPFMKNIPLKPIKEGQRIVLRNIFFETNSSELLADSRTELEKLVQLLEENRQVNIEIGGHTDNVGTEEYNQKLSEARAKSVVDYLIEHGINKDNLSFKGYGETDPVAENNSEQGRAQNRRTEIKILSINKKEGKEQ